MFRRIFVAAGLVAAAGLAVAQAAYPTKTITMIVNRTIRPPRPR